MIVDFLSCNEVPSDYRADFEPMISLDDVPLVKSLEARGAKVRAFDWKAVHPADVDGDITLIRSCWNYHRSPDAFRRWMEEARACQMQLSNSPELVLGTMDKRYLLDLQAGGIPTVSTRLFEASHTPAFCREVFAAERLIAKPVVGASSEGVFNMGPEVAAWPDALVQTVNAGMDYLIQPFMPQIFEGELSLMILGGTFSHAVRKVPAKGDFRVQYEYGGRNEPVAVDAALIEQAEEAARFFGEPLYARVDGVVSGGTFRLMELELIEPELFLVGHELAAERLAALVMGER